MTQISINPSCRTATSSFPDRCSSLRLGRHNLFDVVRLYAAVQVLIVHGATHLHFHLPNLVALIFSLPGVPIFFSISGFLVGLSSLRFRRRWGEYAWHRVLRIFPALWICLVVSIVILVVFGKGWFLLTPPGIIWLFCQASIVQFFNPTELRDFGVGVLNGSLWTIPVELQMYAVLPLFVVLAGALNRRVVALLLAAAAYMSFFLKQVVIGGADNPGSFFVRLLEVSFAPHLFQFLFGFACLIPLVFLGRKKTIFLLLAVGLASIALSGWLAGASTLLESIALAALPIGIGLIPFDLLRGFDISYGLYLYHMPIANALLASKVSTGFSVNAYFFLTFSIATASWLLVEKPVLSLKSKVPFFKPKSSQS